PARRVDRLVPRRDQRQRPVAGHDVVDQPNRALLADRQRRHRLREDDGLLQGEDRQGRGEVELLVRRLLRLEPEVGHGPVVPERVIVTRPRGCARVATGSTIVSTPLSNDADACEGSTSSARRTCRWNVPYSISICW